MGDEWNGEEIDPSAWRTIPLQLSGMSFLRSNPVLQMGENELAQTSLPVFYFFSHNHNPPYKHVFT
jgi:hypothetical protein